MPDYDLRNWRGKNDWHWRLKSGCTKIFAGLHVKNINRFNNSFGVGMIADAKNQNPPKDRRFMNELLHENTKYQDAADAVAVTSREGLTFIEQLQNCSVKKCSKENRPFLVGVSENHKTALLTRPDCKQWDCPECSAKNARVWIAKIINGCNKLGGEWYFLTITVGSKARKEKSTEVLREGWERVYGCINALFSRDGNTPHYSKVWEQQEDGSFHIHALMDVIMSKRWTKDTAVAAGLGHQADWRKIDNAGQVAGYIAKYTLKNATIARGGVEWPKGLRRIETSRNWPKLPKKEQENQWEWVLKWTRQEQIESAQRYHLRGFDILDQTSNKEYVD